MGDVYQAHDTKLNRDVAIKVSSRGLQTIPTALPISARSANVAALNHPTSNDHGAGRLMCELFGDGVVSPAYAGRTS